MDLQIQGLSVGLFGKTSCGLTEPEIVNILFTETAPFMYMYYIFNICIVCCREKQCDLAMNMENV